jgi:ATP-dependent 26S proteasome regulatory subunit
VAKDAKKGYFTLIKKTAFSELAKKGKHKIPESDLCFQDSKNIYQFRFNEPDEDRKMVIKPGVYNIQYEVNNVVPKKTELRNRNLLTSVSNTKSIVDEADLFFNNLDVYDFLGEPKSRKILLYSDPGMGKTATITQYCTQAIAQDPGTVIMLWPTSEVEAADVSKFLSKNSKFNKKCTRLILTMEDIGGGEREGSGNARAVDSAMLNLLDGLEVTFKLPTLIIATTNYPQNLLSALADRPGRFDLILPLQPPPYEEKVQLLEFISKNPVDDATKEALRDRKAENLSIAHLKEIVIRSMLRKVPMAVMVKEIIKHRDRFKKGFEEGGDLGFGRD